MGFFSKTRKAKAKIVVDGIEASFDRDYDWWDFTYRGTQFCASEPEFTLPTKMELDGILNTLEALKPEMRSRIEKEIRVYENVKLDDGESCSVDIQNFAIDKTFCVSWGDGASWGDLFVEFTINDHVIVDERWGD